MWKKAFVVLISLDLLIAVAGVVWFRSLPRAANLPPPRASTQNQQQLAQIELSMGAQAINTYLEYGLAKQKDLSQVVTYANVGFGNHWTVRFGLRLGNRVLPVTIVITPHIQSGNLGLQMISAQLGGLPVPPALLMMTFRQVPWPNWIFVSTATDTLQLNFTKRSPSPYGLRILSYSSNTKQLSMRVLIAPKSALAGGI